MAEDSGIGQRARFDRIRYAQVWEDTDVLLAGLRVRPGDEVLSIASAGDNALALLLGDPSRVIAIDISEAQLHCLRFKIAAYRILDQPDYLELFGAQPSHRRGLLFDRIVPALDEEAQRFWRACRAEVIAHGLGGIGKFERYFRIFRRFVLPLVHGAPTISALLKPMAKAKRVDFFVARWDTWRWRLVLRLFFSRAVMGRLGRSPAFFAHVEGSVAKQVADKVRDALTRLDPTENPFLHWILTGRFGKALPLALRPEAFATIRERLDRIVVRRASLESLGSGTDRFDAFNLSDAFEYMGPQDFEACYASLVDVAKPGARLLHWIMMVPRPVPGACARLVARDPALETELKTRDKAFFYADLVIAERQA